MVSLDQFLVGESFFDNHVLIQSLFGSNAWALRRLQSPSIPTNPIAQTLPQILVQQTLSAAYTVPLLFL